MLELEHESQLKSVICYSRIFNEENHIAILDAKKALRTFSIEDYQTVSGIHVPNVSPAHFGRNSKMVSFSPNKHLVAITDIDEKIVYVYDVLRRKLAFDVTWHKGLAEVLEFDPLNRYLATGGQDGKLCLWFFNTGKLAYTVTSHQDFLSCIVFESTGKFLASSAYDKTIMIMSLYTMNTVCSFRGKHLAVITNMMFAPGEEVLISADRSGKVALWDYGKNKFLDFIVTLGSQPTGMCIIRKTFLLISTQNGSVTLYNLAERELVDKNYIFVKEGIQNIFYFDKLSKIVIVTLKKALMTYSPFGNAQKLKTTIASRNYEEAYHIIRENLILRYSSEYGSLEDAWQNAWQDALVALEEEDSSSAKSILEPFADIPEKREDVKTLISSYKEFQKFKAAIEKKNYQLAYSLLNAYPIYKDSSIYNIMQEDWEERVGKALRVIESNPSDLDDRLKVLFLDFRGISKKLQFIRECRDKKNVLSMFNKFLSQQKYFACFELITKHPFLKQLREYENIILLQESLSEQAQSALDNGEWQNAKSYATELLVFPDYEEIAKQILTHIDQTARFYTFLSQKDYASMIKLANRYTFLKTLKEYENFFKHCDKVIAKAEDFVSKGNIARILQIAKPYGQIPELAERFGKILASTYVQQLFYLVKKSAKTSTILSSLNIYVQIFGADNSLMMYITHLKNNLGINLINEGELDSDKLKPNYKKWLTMKLPAKIFDSL